MGKVHYRCLEEQTEIIIPAQCIDTFCIGKNFPLDQAEGDVFIQVREKAISIEPRREEANDSGSVHGTYTRDDDNIRVFLPAHVCEAAFDAETEGELRIEVVDDVVLASKI